MMAMQNLLVVLLLLVLVGSSVSYNSGINASAATSSVNRSSFPAGFIFGTASASYQYEGAAREGGKGPSIWDYYTHKYPEKIKDGSSGDVANDEYHRYKEDVGIMEDMGLDAYRFSISWSRILPNGKLSGGVNNEGIKYYNNLINELLSHDIQPFVTLFHFDLPQTLEEDYGGFLSRRIVSHFRDYAETCFKYFGDRVKYWITLNEPWSFSMGGYASGSLAPFRCSAWQQFNCTGGDSATEPYLTGHNQLLAHAAAINLYRQKYQETQKGKIGITLATLWVVPYSSARHHQNAALRALDFNFGWFMDPISNGDYPHTMRSLVGDRLPKFTREESKMLKGSFDFVGLNYYTAYYAADVHTSNNPVNASSLTDSHANLSSVRNGLPIGPQAASSWLFVYPRGIRDLLLYAKKKYNNPLIYITENGIDEFNNATLSLEEALNDQMRIDYYSKHLYFLQRAVVKDGVNVKGYFAWSLLDNFEWNSGYTVRFGINYVDYQNGLKRYPKSSAHWFKNFLKK
ncbi:beta-glucosidase 12-like [Tripterygium wilfordii]|uniref:Beta-glucosidase 12-like n=1 Tax=Tripterygium wilfordii TaxID=458696 RepID=A0A7J7DRK2_TRIWF|nr:beta-glucosidase 12-like [Tripterygium wilfordii]KAF5748784.1 beta-glucosidase 12-like [Tripterygium wilfordii]